MTCKSLLAALIVLASASAARATVVIDNSAAIQGRGGSAGLAGTYYQPPSNSTHFTIADTLNEMYVTPAYGHFTATSLNYSGSDTSTITSFLGADGASYTGRAAANSSMQDGILDMSGFLYVAAPATLSFALSHDDSAQLRIGNQTIISANCCGTNTALVSFGTAGYYAFDLVYSNTNYYGVGSGSVNLTQNGQTLTAANLVQNVPEPASLAVLGVALVGLGLVWRGRPLTNA